MKNKKIIAIAFVLLCIVISIGVVMINLKKVEIGNIKSLRYSFSSSMAMNGYERYELDCENQCIAKIKPCNEPEENIKEVEIERKKVEEIENILKKYNVGNWNGFKKSDKNILDGRSFSFYVKMENGDSIDATGYMKYPKNYSQVSSELISLFESFFNEE